MSVARKPEAFRRRHPAHIDQCRFVEAINGTPNPIKHTGRSAYRCMVPFDKIMSDPLTRPLFENQPAGLFGPNLMSKGIIVGSYPCRRGEVLSVAMLHSTKKKEEDAQGEYLVMLELRRYLGTLMRR